MRPSYRWPLHPAPVEGEALSSWLYRIARCYRMGLSDLLEHDLGDHRSDDLDTAPPAALLDTVARRSGVERDRLRCMTLAGFMPGLFFLWEKADMRPRPATEAVALMDRRTWQALTSGYVDLPRRRVHAGLWFRLLRTILEELSTAPSHHRAQVEDLRRIWEHSGHPVRAGLRSWRPYESLDLSLQLRFLEAAAVAIRMIETGELTARGSDAALFRPEPLLDGVDAWRSHGPAVRLTPWERVTAAAEATIAEAKRSPEAARALFDLILFGRKDAEAARWVHSLLAEVGIPPEFLSHDTSSLLICSRAKTVAVTIVHLYYNYT